MTQLPPPSSLINIPKFSSWYPGQEAIFSRMLDWYYSPSRFLGMSVATGSGKSLSAILLARLTNARTVIITETKGLQDQYIDSFASTGLTLLKGQNNFQCALVPALRADEGPCHDGIPCDLPETGSCPYRRQLSVALKSRIVITNYAYYLAQTNFSSGIGDVDLLIEDEAHRAFASLDNHLQIYLTRMDVESCGLSFPSPSSSTSLLWAFWQCWAEESIPTVEAVRSRIESDIKDRRQLSNFIPPALSRSYRQVKSLIARLSSISSATGIWVIQPFANSYRFTPLWVSSYSSALFHNVTKIVLMSAILTPKTADVLGVPADESRTWLEVPSYFPPQNTPIWHIPTARINFRTDDFGTTLWLSRIDQIIQRRQDRKGIIFTVSYDRARLILQRSRFKDIMIDHTAKDVTYAVNKFKAMKAPAVLVSPTVTTGWDFPQTPGEKPQYIIIGKLPYPDTEDPVMKARHETDKVWSSFMAMETLVQECGRMSRSSTDKTEVLIIDDSVTWFMRQYGMFSPGWFRARYRGSLRFVPDPMVN